jgi:hypothetical protein
MARAPPREKAFSLYAGDGVEPPHVHVQKGDGEAKLWLRPVELVYSYRITPGELRRIRELTFQHQAAFLERWNEHFRG